MFELGGEFVGGVSGGGGGGGGGGVGGMDSWDEGMGGRMHGLYKTKTRSGTWDEQDGSEIYQLAAYEYMDQTQDR